MFYLEKFKVLNHDYEESIRLPCLFCETRWIDVAGQMQWILKYGRLYHRYQLAKNTIQPELVKHNYSDQTHKTTGRREKEKRRRRKVRGRRQSAATISLDNGLKFKEEVDLVIQRMKR